MNRRSRTNDQSWCSENKFSAKIDWHAKYPPRFDAPQHLIPFTLSKEYILRQLKIKFDASKFFDSYKNIFLALFQLKRFYAKVVQVVSY